MHVTSQAVDRKLEDRFKKFKSERLVSLVHSKSCFYVNHELFRLNVSVGGGGTKILPPGTYLASSARAKTPAASGAAADVPE